MHNLAVEMQGKCRRLFYAKTVMLNPDESVCHAVGDVVGVASGGGALEELTGDALIVATYNDHTAPERIGCVEEFYSPVPSRKPLKVDMTKVQTCHDAVESHRVARKAEADFVFEKGITLFGSEQPTTESLRHTLKVQELHTRDNSDRVSDHDAIVQAQTDLEALCKTCEDCCEQLLVTRDAAITFAEPES
jgi:hypothetical protein